MSHTITLSNDTFSVLQALATPFVDTPESVIAALAKAELARRESGTNGAAGSSTNGQEIEHFDPDNPESLTHARLLSATLDGEPMHRPKWNGLMDHLHVLAADRFGSFEQVKRSTSANLWDGRYEESGYRFLPEAGFSIQGVDANLAWSHSLAVARALKMPIEVRFEWRDREGAARPGQQGIISWAPSGNGS